MHNFRTGIIDSKRGEHGQHARVVETALSVCLYIANTYQSVYVRMIQNVGGSVRLMSPSGSHKPSLLS